MKYEIIKSSVLILWRAVMGIITAMINHPSVVMSVFELYNLAIKLLYILENKKFFNVFVEYNEPRMVAKRKNIIVAVS